MNIMTLWESSSWVAYDLVARSPPLRQCIIRARLHILQVESIPFDKFRHTVNVHYPKKVRIKNTLKICTCCSLSTSFGFSSAPWILMPNKPPISSAFGVAESASPLQQATDLPIEFDRLVDNFLQK